MKPSTQASILGVLIFAGVVTVMAYIQRKAGPVARNVVPFPEMIDGQEVLFL